MEKKCCMCGKEAKFESMTLASPVCPECAEKMMEMYNRNRAVELEVEDMYVPFAGDVTMVREAR